MHEHGKAIPYSHPPDEGPDLAFRELQSPRGLHLGPVAHVPGSFPILPSQNEGDIGDGNVPAQPTQTLATTRLSIRTSTTALATAPASPWLWAPVDLELISKLTQPSKRQKMYGKGKRARKLSRAMRRKLKQLNTHRETRVFGNIPQLPSPRPITPQDTPRSVLEDPQLRVSGGGDHDGDDNPQGAKRRRSSPDNCDSASQISSTEALPLTDVVIASVEQPCIPVIAPNEARDSTRDDRLGEIVNGSLGPSVPFYLLPGYGIEDGEFVICFSRGSRGEKRKRR